MASLRLAALPILALLFVGALHGCADGPATETPGDAGTSDGSRSKDSGGGATDDDPTETDASTNADDSGSGNDSGTCSGPIVTTPGETCVGFGAKAETCDPACGQSYGYVCFDGAPPGFTGCRKVTDTSFGQTYCCPKNECVAQPDQDAMWCSGVAGKPHRFQCPPNGNGGHVAPPAGCEEKGSGGSNVEKFYCCP